MLMYKISMGLFYFLSVVVTLNLMAWVFLRCIPEAFLDKRERKRNDPNTWYEEPGREKAYLWFGFEDKSGFVRFLKEKRKSGNFQIEYEPLTDFRHQPFSSKYINISEHGFRLVKNQGPWPLESSYYNIFVFGGSTVFSWGTDESAMPSYLQEALKKFDGKEVKVYNFGRGAYYASQEKVLFFQLLECGHRPDAVVFLHGLNDFVRYDGFTVTSWLYKEALRGYNASYQEHSRAQSEGKIRWFRLSMFLMSLPLYTVIRGLVRRIGVRSVVSEVPPYTKDLPLTEHQIDQVVNRLLNVHRQILEVSKAYRITPWIVLQPHPAYGYDLSNHAGLSLKDGLLGNERAGQGYPVLLKAVKQAALYGNSLIDLSEIQKDFKKNLYLDEAHYTAEFSKQIARRVCNCIIERKNKCGLP